MNLYATVTSERASKGQGGQYLDIVVQDSNKEILARLFIESYTDSVGDGYKGTLSTAEHLYLTAQGDHISTDDTVIGLCTECDEPITNRLHTCKAEKGEK